MGVPSGLALTNNNPEFVLHFSHLRVLAELSPVSLRPHHAHRGMYVDLSSKTTRVLVISGKCWGVLLLLTCSYFAHVLAS